MTRNLYLGADLHPIVSAAASGNQAKTVQAVTDAWTNIVNTKFPERADALANEIAQSQPQLVNLQEVSRYSVSDPYFLGAPPKHASELNGDDDPDPLPSDVPYNFLRDLQNALTNRDLNYKPVVINKNYDIELPKWYDTSTSPPTLQNIRLIDRDVILARADLPVSNVQKKNFATNLTLPLKDQNGNPVVLTRGWASVDVTVGDKSLRLIDTHLEEGSSAINEAQGNEILSGPANTRLPMILAGDFSLPADEATTYTNLINTGGFVDAWSATHSQEAGLTCCQQADLLNTTSALTQRVDLVLFREGRKAGLSAADAQVVGDEPSDRTPSSGLWPSDHAGVVGTLNR